MKKYTLMILPEFLELAGSLSKEAKLKLVKIMKLLSGNIRHPSLQTKRVKGSANIFYECRVDQGIRLIYDKTNSTLRCWYVGEHDSALRFAISGIGGLGVHVDDIELLEIDKNYAAKSFEDDTKLFIEINVEQLADLFNIK